MESKPIGLRELVLKVKEELLSRESLKTDPAPLLAVDEVELELAVSVTREGEAGISLQVLSLGGSRSREDTQTVRVRLKPLFDKEELITDLRERDPDLYERARAAAGRTLKGPTWDNEEKQSETSKG
jgi:hypothetical protein